MRRHQRWASVAVAAWAFSVAAQVEPPMHGHKVARVTVSTAAELRTVLALTDDPWTCQGPGLGSFDARFSPEQYKTLKATGIPHEVVIQDVQAVAEAEFARVNQAGPGDDDFYGDFRRLSWLNARMNALGATFPACVRVGVAGRSFEGRGIGMVRVTGQENNPGTRPVVWIIGGQHAREWLSPMVTLHIAERLALDYDRGHMLWKPLLDRVEFIIVPLVNPDGYVYTWAHPNNRYWRKNRSAWPNHVCHGVDLNRNWAHAWGTGVGSWGVSCHATYRGPNAWSEPETAAMRNLGNAIRSRVEGFVDIHSYKQVILWPWAATAAAPPDALFLNALAAGMRDSIEQLPARRAYTIGQAFSALYPADGTAADWVHALTGRPSYTIELPPRNASPDLAGFSPPPSVIRPVGSEVFQSMLILALMTASERCPSPPEDIAATSGPGPIHVTWTPDDRATKYTIWRGRTSNEEQAVQIGTRSAPPFSDTSAAQWTTYYYWVKSVGICGPGEFGDFATGLRW